MKKTGWMAAIASAVLVLGGNVFAADATEIMNKCTSIDVPDYSRTTLIMELVDKNGKVTEKREILQFGNRVNDVISTVFDLRSPATVKDTRILQAEKKGKSDDKYIYLPSLKTTRRIAAAERQKSWVGSDFTYNDMTIRHAEDDAHTMLDENATFKSNGGQSYACWKIKSVPVANKNVEFAYRILYVDKNSYLPLSCEYYDKKDTLIKTQNIEKFEQVTASSGKKYWLRELVRTKNELSGHATTVAVPKYDFDTKISDRYFTQNWLNTGK